jgi:hypothetical protein
MRQAITSQQDFDQKVKNSSGGILLLFHSDASSDQDLQKYQDQAEDKCDSNFRVYTVNIDHIILSANDIATYQSGVNVICCTVLFNSGVHYKQVDPDPAELWLKIEC